MINCKKGFIAFAMLLVFFLFSLVFIFTTIYINQKSTYGSIYDKSIESSYKIDSVVNIISNITKQFISETVINGNDEDLWDPDELTVLNNNISLVINEDIYEDVKVLETTITGVDSSIYCVEINDGGNLVGYDCDEEHFDIIVRYDILLNNEEFNLIYYVKGIYLESVNIMIGINVDEITTELYNLGYEF